MELARSLKRAIMDREEWGLQRTNSLRKVWHIPGKMKQNTNQTKLKKKWEQRGEIAPLIRTMEMVTGKAGGREPETWTRRKLESSFSTLGERSWAPSAKVRIILSFWPQKAPWGWWHHYFQFRLSCECAKKRSWGTEQSEGLQATSFPKI